MLRWSAVAGALPSIGTVWIGRVGTNLECCGIIRLAYRIKTDTKIVWSCVIYTRRGWDNACSHIVFTVYRVIYFCPHHTLNICRRARMSCLNHARIKVGRLICIRPATFRNNAYNSKTDMNVFTCLNLCSWSRKNEQDGQQCNHQEEADDFYQFTHGKYPFPVSFVFPSI